MSCMIKEGAEIYAPVQDQRQSGMTDLSINLDSGLISMHSSTTAAIVTSI